MDRSQAVDADRRRGSESTFPDESALELLDEFPTETVDGMPGIDLIATEQKIIVSPRAAALVASIFGVACLATLAIVAAVRDADALSTIALALAIVAFGVQLLASAAQNQSASQQSLRSEQLNTQTRALLAEMQTTARSTESMVRDQFGQLLRAFMDAAKAAERGKGFDEQEFRRQLRENIREEAASANERSASTPASAAASVGDRTQSTLARRRALAQQRSRQRANFVVGPFPSEDEVSDILPDLLALSVDARQRLRDFGRDKAEEGGSSGYEGYPAPSQDPTAAELDKELRDRGFIHLVRTGTGSTGTVHQLTPKGDSGVRVLAGTGPIPPWAEPLFQ